MYEHKGLGDILFIMLYGGATMLAVVACFYLLLTHGNIFSSTVNPPRSLRRWAAAFLASVAASHVWWVVLGLYWLVDDRLMRNIVAITLDRLTFVPLMMVVLLRMLQDKHRKAWPIALAMLPFAVIAVYSVIARSNAFEWFVEGYSFFIGIVFILYYVYAVRQYGRWLHDNFSDLEHKEVWQSLALLAFILVVYMCYTSNEGALATEYLAQVNTLIIIGFVLWRVETLQQLDAENAEEIVNGSETFESKEDVAAFSIQANIGMLLEQQCKAKQLYLQHDLTLKQLSVVIGTNRTYLSAYFAQQGITYNTYINSLRIEHFISLYRKSAESSLSVNATKLAQQSGFGSYSTFSVAFKRYTGSTVSTWMRQEACSHDIA